MRKHICKLAHFSETGWTFIVNTVTDTLTCLNFANITMMYSYTVTVPDGIITSYKNVA